MSHLIASVDDDHFTAAVLESDRPVVVDFSAAWCPPCRVIAPILAKLATERPDIAFVEIDTDANVEVAARYGVLSMPTLIVFCDGQETGRIVGSRPERKLAQDLDAALGRTATAAQAAAQA